MDARAKLFGHPVHQMLIVFPLGLLATAVVFDIIRLVTGNSVWSTASYYMTGAGIVTGLLAAPFGFVDWRGIPPNTRAKRIGALHGIGNVVVVLLFAGSWYLRRGAPAAPSTAALVLAVLGLLLALVTAWLGGELVDRLGVGVYDDANLDAPSSLSGRPARAAAGGGPGAPRRA
jgi:uncharacterized membrane protein